MSLKDLVIGGLAVVALVLGYLGYTRELPLGATPGGFFDDLVELVAGSEKRNTVATSTTDTAMTFVINDLVNQRTGGFYDVIYVTPQTADLTYTFMASSSLASVLRGSGMAEQCFYNATSTAGIDVIFAAGTGIDLQNASSSATDLTIPNGRTACFKYIRQIDTDISALLTEYTDSD